MHESCVKVPKVGGLGGHSGLPSRLCLAWRSGVLEVGFVRFLHGKFCPFGSTKVSAFLHGIFFAFAWEFGLCIVY